MRIERRYTRHGHSPYDGITFRTAVSEIRNPDGSTVFRLDNVEVPAAWSQVATDIISAEPVLRSDVRTDGDVVPVRVVDSVGAEQRAEHDQQHHDRHDRECRHGGTVAPQAVPGVVPQAAAFLGRYGCRCRRGAHNFTRGSSQR